MAEMVFPAQLLLADLVKEPLVVDSTVPACRGLPGHAPGCPSFPLTALSGPPDTPFQPREAASQEPWQPAVASPARLQRRAARKRGHLDAPLKSKLSPLLLRRGRSYGGPSIS